MQHTIILGREGNQPFSLDGSSISRRHAEITITDDGQWTLRDLQSTNGTFVRNDDTGLLQQVDTVVITPMTFICLGADNSKGNGFYARQVLAPGNYDEEWLAMNAHEDRFEREEKRVEEIGKWLNLVKIISPFAIFALLTIVWKMDGTEAYLIRAAFSALPTGIIQLAYNPTRIKRNINRRRERFSHCPNPECSRRLKPSEIRAMDCMKCHC